MRRGLAEGRRQVKVARRDEKSVPAHRRRQVCWAGVRWDREVLLRSDYCWRCKKLSHRDKIDARSAISALLTAPGFKPRPDDHLLTPYRCAHGKGWHIGHNRRAKRMLAKAARAQKAMAR